MLICRILTQDYARIMAARSDVTVGFSISSRRPPAFPSKACTASGEMLGSLVSP